MTEVIFVKTCLCVLPTEADVDYKNMLAIKLMIHSTVDFVSHNYVLEDNITLFRAIYLHVSFSRGDIAFFENLS